MCSHYRAPEVTLFRKMFGRARIERPAGIRDDLWPGYRGPFLRRPLERDSGDEAVPELEALPGVFGLLPHWAKDETLAKRTYNARSETAAEKPSFRDAWRHAQHCIIPAESIYEPDWRSGKAVPTRIRLANGEPMGIAGLWERWKSPAGEIVHSYTMLTINADRHPLMKDYHRPGDEKRMVVILPAGLHDDWLNAPATASMEFMQPYPADRLEATPEPRRPPAASAD